jgi:hypothetical protein
MKGNSVLQQKLLLVLIAAIIIVCAAFIFMSCGKSGKGPQAKIANPDRGPYALDFTDCRSTSQCTASLANNRKIANKDLTVEAWVKSRSADPNDFSGGIFGRFDVGGIVLYTKNGEPKAAIRRVGASGTATATADYIVSSGIQIVDHAWHHIAAVLTGADHSAVHANCGAADGDNRTDTVDCTPAICNNNIHLDIYVDGEYKECNTTYGEDNDTTVTQPTYAGEAVGDYEVVGNVSENLPFDFDGFSVGVPRPFPGVIDEVRLWGVARTQSQINQCMSGELRLDSGTCGRITNDCLSYLRLNEGKGSVINDWCGLGTGVLEMPVSGEGLLDWTTGWTTDTPNLKRTD